MSPFETKIISTSAGDYVVELFPDDSAENPLTDWDNPGMAFHVSGGDSITTDTLDNAGAAGDVLKQLASEYMDNPYRYGTDVDAVERRYAKWRAISGSPWRLVTGTGRGNVQGHWWEWLVLVDMTPGEWGSDTTAEKLASGMMDTYQAWASGNVFGYVVTAPDGTDVDSCWGFYDVNDERDYVMGLARDTIATDVDKRNAQCQLVGAGFVGLI